jgi:monofunctional chorismate mutase
MSRVSSVSTIAAVRGAVTVPTNTAPAIRAATARLLQALLRSNRLGPGQVVSALFTTTPDLDADYPAHAARLLGWHDVPLLGAREILPPGALPRVVRVLLTVRDVASPRALRPVYLGGARALRPDLTGARAERRARASRRKTTRIALIGLGQIGGSLGLALADSVWWRVGYDLKAGTRRAALRGGAIDQASDSLRAACAKADLAVVAVPMDRMAAVIDAVAAALPRGAALLDTGSARGALVAALERARRRGLQAVGGHPIAGSHGRGFAAARAGLFEGATFCVTPLGRAVPAVVRRLIRDVGARARRLSAPAHDRALARTSHLPYLVASAVRDLGRAAAARGLAGGSFADMTRVAASDPAMATAYCRANAGEIRAAWRQLRESLDRRVDRLGREGRG